MSGDPRFSRLKTDPRFRRPAKHRAKVVVDERFKDVFNDGEKKKSLKIKSRVDKYGRTISDTRERDDLRKFYRLENDAEDATLPDYARGGVLMESSDESEDDDADSDTQSVVVLGLDPTKPIPVPEDAEVDLDEDAYADLDAQAAAYSSTQDKEDGRADSDVPRTSRLAVVNLDWDHVRASHLYKICASLVSPSAPASAPSSIHPDRVGGIKTKTTTVVRGRILNVRIFPSEFGAKRMAKEEEEGPPSYLFKKTDQVLDEDDVNEKSIYQIGGEEEYDEDALRTYQLERLRYYYAIITCDTVEAASHIFDELEGTELERSANVFDLSFVPDGMKFDGECKEEASEEKFSTYKLDFVTDALRHSKVKLTWDEDDAQRNQVTRRALTKEDIEKGDFKAYLASSGSEAESDAAPVKTSQKSKAESRDKLRALLLGGNDDDMPEGWGREDDIDPKDVDMEITFTSGLSSNKKAIEDENTLEKYERKKREKRKKRKEELSAKVVAKEKKSVDDFFDDGSDAKDELIPAKGKNRTRRPEKPASAPRHETTAEELALIATSDGLNGPPDHFDMKAVLKAEKRGKLKGKRAKKAKDADAEVQESFSIDVTDERFKALHEDHMFAIDPSNPQFKKTKSMAALLEERSKRQKSKKRVSEGAESKTQNTSGRSLAALVDSVKRKSLASGQKPEGKRRKLD